MVKDKPVNRARALSGVLWDLGGTLSMHGVGFLISIVLARLLAPAEFGLVGMALVLINIFQVFSDFGFASALIQSRENNSLTYSSIFYVNLVAGFCLFLLFQVLAPVFGKLYSNADIVTLIRWLSLGFVISSFRIVQETILRRNIEFRKLTIRNVLSQIVGGLFGVYLAFQGVGVYALVVQNLISSLVNSLILWRVSEWYPKLEFSLAEVKKLSGFSVYVFFSQILNQIVNQLDVFLVGAIFSPTKLGFYSRADSINKLVNRYTSSTLTRVFYPVLSKVQDDDEGFFRIYDSVTHLIAFGSFLLSGTIILAGPDLIVLLFGVKWQPSVIILQVLALKSFTYPVSAIVVNAFLAKGKARENFWYGNIRKVVTLSAFLIAARWGFEVFLWAIVVVAYLNWFLNSIFAAQTLNIPFMAQLKPVGVYGMIFGIAYAVISYLAGTIGLSNGFALAVGFAIIYFSICSVFGTKGLRLAKRNALELWSKLRVSRGH